MSLLKLKLVYANTENYKSLFEFQLSLEEFPKASSLQKGSTIKMGEFGTPNQNQFFASELCPHEFDCWEDVSTFCVEEIITL